MTSSDALRSIRDEYTAAAERYEARWPEYIRHTTGRTLEHVEIQPGARLLDVGCGTGALLRTAAARFPGTWLAGADLVPAMLRVARRADERTPLVASDAAALPFADRCIDVVVSVSSLHFWPDPVTVLREAARVLRPGGLLVLTDWCADFLRVRIIDRALRLSGRASYHRMYRVRECAALLDDAGFSIRAQERHTAGAQWGLMTLACVLDRRAAS